MGRIFSNQTPIPPRGNALVLCEDYVDRGPGQLRDLVGIFDILTVSGLPATMKKCFAWFSVAGSGTVDFLFSLTGPDGQVVHAGGFRVSEFGATGTCESAVELHDLSFAQTGIYLLRLFTASGTLLERNLLVQTD